MRICYLTNNIDPETGCGKLSHKLIETVKAERPEWEIVALTTKKTGDLKEEIPLIYPNKYKLLSNLTRIRSIIKKCDLVHALDGFPYGLVSAVVNFGVNKKLIITGIGTGSIKPLYNSFYSILLKWAYRRADKVTAISHYTAREINKVIPDLEIEAIPLGVDFEEFSKIDLEQVPEKIKNKKPYILSVGAFKKRKGYHISLLAFAKVLEKIPDLNYVIVGDSQKGSDYFLELKKIAKDLGIEDRVFIFSNINREFLRKLYNNAELFFLISQDIEKDVEGFGLVFLEAAASGLPVIGSKDTGAEDAILDRENGFLVKQDDIEEITVAILRLLKDKNLRNKLSRKSIEFAKQSSWKSRLGVYIKIYKNLLE
jgi:glycosyltransferase involved in cell wall biosynthesis